MQNLKHLHGHLLITKDFGEMAEWFKAHAWKVCVPSQVPWVRIPLSPPSDYGLLGRNFSKYEY